MKLMVRAVIIGLIVTGAWSCTKKDNDFMSFQKQISFEDAKLILSNSKNQENLITKIENLTQNKQITFEDGSKISIDDSRISSISFDSTQWLATFNFSDRTSTSAYFLGNVEIDSTDVTLNPYSVCPLAAIAKFDIPVKSFVEVIVHAKDEHGVSISKNFQQYSTHHETPILGLYDGYKNQVEIVLKNIKGQNRISKIIDVTTAPLSNKPNIRVNTNAIGKNYDGIYIVSSLRMGFDQTGEIRWINTSPSSAHYSFMRKLKSGNMLLTSPDGRWFSEVTMLGQVIKSYSVPGGIHHDIIELPNDNFLVTSSTVGGATMEDLIVEIDRFGGNITRSIDLSKMLDPNRRSLPDVIEGDWFHMNSLFYDNTDNSVIVSGRSQSCVIKIDYGTGALKWILGNPNYWTDSFHNYLLTPVNANNQPLDRNTQGDFWPYGQHAAQSLTNGNILMFDDGDYRNFYDNLAVSQSSYSRGVEYAIDEQNKTVQLVWHFDYNKLLFTPYTGFIQNLTSGNRLISYMDGQPNGNAPKIVEVDSNNNIVVDIDFNNGSLYYRTAKYDLYEGIE